MKHLIALIALLSLLSCTEDDCVSGNSNYIQKSINLSSFENVTNSFPGTVKLRNGSFGLNYTIESNVESLFDLELDNGTLKFSTVEDKCFNSNGIHFEVFAQTYKELKNNGSANWTSEFLLCDPSIISNGSGNIQLIGKSTNQNVVISGSGNVDLSLMPTQNITIRNNSSGKVKAVAIGNANVIINGSGSVEIDSLLGELKVEINGSGNLIYSGEPKQLIYEINGSGKLLKK